MTLSSRCAPPVKSIKVIGLTDLLFVSVYCVTFLGENQSKIPVVTAIAVAFLRAGIPAPSMTCGLEKAMSLHLQEPLLIGSDAAAGPA